MIGCFERCAVLHKESDCDFEQIKFKVKKLESKNYSII